MIPSQVSVTRSRSPGSYRNRFVSTWEMEAYLFIANLHCATVSISCPGPYFLIIKEGKPGLHLPEACNGERLWMMNKLQFPTGLKIKKATGPWNGRLQTGTVPYAHNFSIWKAEQENRCELQVSLEYTMSSRQAWKAEWDVSPTNKKLCTWLCAYVHACIHIRMCKY